MGTMPDLGLVCGVDSHADTIMAAVCDPTGGCWESGRQPGSQHALRTIALVRMRSHPATAATSNAAPAKGSPNPKSSAASNGT
jgi:hypothetical protein